MEDSRLGNGTKVRLKLRRANVRGRFRSDSPCTCIASVDEVQLSHTQTGSFREDTLTHAGIRCVDGMSKQRMLRVSAEIQFLDSMSKQ
jgi:hypothetical protein